MTNFRFGIDADAIERSVRHSLRGLEETLEGLHDLHFGRERDVEIDETIEVGPGAELIITTLGGDVEVRGANGSSIRIKAEGESALPDTPSVHRDGNRVIFNAPHGSEIDVEAVVPHDCTVRVTTGDGDVEIEDTGAIEVKTMSGDVTAEDIAGDCTVTTGQADVTVERMNGALIAHTINGDIEISRSQLRSAQVHSVDGELTLDAVLGDGPFTIQTVNGDVDLMLPRDAGAEIVFHTANGDFSCDLPAQVTKSTSREWQAQVNGGGTRIEITTVNGDVEIGAGRSAAFSDTRVPAQPVPPVPPVPAVPSEPAMPPDAPTSAGPGRDTTDVLKALERGEISVDEAMERLSGA